MNRRLNVLSIEDSQPDFLQIERLLNHAGLIGSLGRVDSVVGLDGALTTGDWHLVLMDLNVPGLDFDYAYERLRARYPDLPVIVVSGRVGEEHVVSLLRHGITDFILKDNLARLPLAVERAIADAERQREVVAAGAALRASEARLWQILQTAQEGIWVVGVNECTTLVNAAMAAMLGYSEDEMMGRPLSSFTDARGLALARAKIGNLADGPASVEGQIRRKDGRLIWVSVNSSPLKTDDGQITGALAMVSDITARRLAEAEMHLQSAALNASADAVAITDPAGAIVWVNRAFETLTGYASAEVIGRNPRQLIRSGVHDAAFYRQMWDTILAREVWRGEITNRRKDGTEYPEEMTITPVCNAGGDIENFVAIKRDVTARKKLEAQLLQAQKMESVGRLAGGIAHDFNNLLTVINGVAELRLDELPEGDPCRKDLLEIHTAGERAAALTRQLLTFSRQQVVRPEIIELNSLVTGTQSMLRRMVGEDILIVARPGPSPLKVKADVGQLEQVLMNLVVNARDAMPNGGRLTISTRGAEFGDDQFVFGGRLAPGSYALLQVMDTGTGMDEATQSRIFDPFFTTKEQGKGTGLGLATVYGIVQQWHGGVTMFSAVGKGSSFTVYLPCVGDDCKASTVLGATVARGSETILLVEDDDSVRITTQRMLRTAGYDVLAVASAEEALVVLDHHDQPLDLLLTDAVMPGLGGPELAARVARTRPKLAIMFMSGHTDNPSLLRSVSEGRHQLLVKPFSAVQLTTAIRAILDAAAIGAPRSSEPSPPSRA